MRKEFPSGWKINENGNLEYTFFQDEIKEMKKQERIMLILTILNIIQSIVILIIVKFQFYNR